MNEKLILNDGTELDGHMLESGGRLFLYIYNTTLANAFSLLIDPEKTKKIIGTQLGVTKTIRGYKHLYAVTEENDEMVSAALRKS